MSDDPQPPPPSAKTRRRPRGRPLAWLVAGLLVVVVVVLILAGYVLRREIGGALARDYLRGRGVESAIAIDSLSTHGFAGSLRLGPPNDPDAVADRIEVDLTIAPPWSATPFKVVARRIRLVRPRLKLALGPHGLSFGALDRLIAPAKPGAPPEPIPDVVVEQGTARIATEAGVLVVRGDAEIDAGRPVSLELRSAPADLRLSGLSARTGPGTLNLDSRGGTVRAELEAPITRLDAGGTRADGVLLDVRFTGTLAGGAGLSARGAATGRIQAGTVSRGPAVARALDAAFDLPALDLALRDGRGSASASGSASAKAASLAQPGTGLGAVSAGLKITRLEAGYAGGRWTGEVRLAGTGAAATGQTTLAGMTLALSHPSAKLDGSLGLAPGGMSANLAGAVSTHAGLSAADAGRLAQAALSAAGDAARTRALAGFLRSFDLNAPRLALTGGPAGARVTLGSPVTATGPSGGRIALSAVGGAPMVLLARDRTSGAAALSAGGAGLPSLDLRVANYALAKGAIQAAVDVHATLDAGTVKGASLAASGQVRGSGGAFAFYPEGCVGLSARRAVFGETAIEAPGGRFCGTAGAPLVAVDGHGWRLTGRIEDGTGASNVNMVRADHLAADVVAAAPNRGAPSASLRLAHVDIADTAKPVRFRPLSADGRLDLANDVVSGRLAVAVGANHPIGAVTLRHQLSTGEGSALIDAPSIRFERDGFHPADLSPMASAAPWARGEVRFKGRVGWSKSGLTSSGELATDGLDLASPAGAVSRIKADIRLTSLFPPELAPGQVITAQKVDSFVPLEALRVVFDLDAKRIGIESGRLSATGGEVSIEPVQFPLANDRAVRGVIVLKGIDLGKVVASSTLADRVKLDAVVNGRLPYEYGPNGFRLLRGAVVAVRAGRLSIRRDVFVGKAQPNAIQDFAYQALANLAFDSMEATVESRPFGRLGVIFHVKGRHDPAVGHEAFIGVGELVDGSAFNKPIPLPKGTPIDLTLDTSLNIDQLLQDYQNAWTLTRARVKTPAGSAAVQP
jgi:hypothetical protein